MNYRLLVDLEAVAVLEYGFAGVRCRLLEHLVKLRLSPETLSVVVSVTKSGAA